MPDLMEKIVSLCKRRGFVYPGSEIYGGLANSWDYGPLGAELKNNIKNLWWKKFVQERDDMVGIDAALIMNPKVWEASGHLKNFNDPLVECKNCHERFRVDALNIDFKKLEVVQEEFLNLAEKNLNKVEIKIEDIRKLINTYNLFLKREKATELSEVEKSGLEIILKELNLERKRQYKENLEFIKIAKSIIEEVQKSRKLQGQIIRIYLNRHAFCPACKEMNWSVPKDFNLMFKTFIGPAEEQANVAYFRPETAQAMFVDFKNVLQSTREKLPFGIAQIGKAFRNEITPGNFIFRTREFEQMEVEYFIAEPKLNKEWEKYFKEWQQEIINWIKEIGIDIKKVHEIDIPDKERAHYSKKTIDFEYEFPFGQKELYGLAYRTDFDLKNHFKDPPYKDAESGKEFWPHVIEPSLGVDRTVLAVLVDAYTEDKNRVFLKIKPKLAPYKAAVFPLLANKPKLVEFAKKIYDSLRKDLMVTWDDRGNIGKRYYSQDEIGTPFCITVDFDTLDNNTVTVRDRDTTKQERVGVNELNKYIGDKLV